MIPQPQQRPKPLVVAHFLNYHAKHLGCSQYYYGYLRQSHNYDYWKAEPEVHNYIGGKENYRIDFKYLAGFAFENHNFICQYFAKGNFNNYYQDFVRNYFGFHNRVGYHHNLYLNLKYPFQKDSYIIEDADLYGLDSSHPSPILRELTFHLIYFLNHQANSFFCLLYYDPLIRQQVDYRW